jgi:glutathione S-transferase
MARLVLWHIPVSHYNEKVRWALDFKGLEYDRRAPQPPVHMLVAMALTRSPHVTFPVLQVDGEAIGDSTAIIAELERRFPDPPLYPPDPSERRRALDLEDFFDEEVGPPIRQLGWHEITRDEKRMTRYIAETTRGPLARFAGAQAAAARRFLDLRFDVASEDGAQESRRRIVAGLDRLEAELGDGDYLVGGRFTVADLTAAALLYPLVLPPEAPRQLGSEPPPAYERFRAPLKNRRGYEWVREMFARHRRRLPVPAGAQP